MENIKLASAKNIDEYYTDKVKDTIQLKKVIDLEYIFNYFLDENSPSLITRDNLIILINKLMKKVYNVKRETIENINIRHEKNPNSEIVVCLSDFDVIHFTINKEYLI